MNNWNYTEFITFEGAMTASELEYRYTKQIHFVKINFQCQTFLHRRKWKTKKQHEETRTIQFDNQILDFIYHFNQSILRIRL